jgi:hypothetical protein
MIRGELEKYRRIGWVAFGMIFGWDLLLRKVIHFLIMNFNKLLNIQINGFLNMCLSNQLSKFKYIEENIHKLRREIWRRIEDELIRLYPWFLNLALQGSLYTYRSLIKLVLAKKLKFQSLVKSSLMDNPGDAFSLFGALCWYSAFKKFGVFLPVSSGMANSRWSEGHFLENCQNYLLLSILDHI